MDTEHAMDTIKPGRLILTVNRRLALEIRDQYNRAQARQGYQAWESLTIASWGDWIHSLFQQLVDHGLSTQTLLNPNQADLLWEQIIRHSEPDSAILRPSSAARMASSAWDLIHAWNIQKWQLSEVATSETERFMAWSDEFQRRCKLEQWVDSALLPDLIAQQLQEHNLTTPNEIIVAGFDEITPQQQSILDLLQEMGCDISSMSPLQTQGSVRRVQAADVAQELDLAARWALKRLQQNGEARVGVVVPQLSELRSRVESVFKQCFHPGSILPGVEDTACSYNISLGVPLNKSPLVVDAFLVLRLATGELPCGDLSRLLRSPFLSGGLAEQQGRARLDAYLRSRIGERTMSLDTLIRITRKFSGRGDNGCPVILQSLESFRLRLDHLPARQSPQNWIDEFNALLNSLGWPCYTRLNSTEYQQAESFKQAMASFQMLGQIQYSMGLSEAIARLQTLTSETLFQPKGDEAPVQIVGILEAAGLGFDHLWVMGLSDDKWPAPAAPNPLLPVSLQRKLDLPHASPQRESEYAGKITARLLSSAADVVVSHAATDGRNDLRVSPLVAGITLSSQDKLDLAPNVVGLSVGFGSVQLEQIVDNMAPALAPGSHMSGGSGLLADQSACPFRAFANHRLGATPVEDPVSGIDARSKGIMVHRVLQQLWGRFGSLDGLLQMNDTNLEQLVADEVDAQLSRLKSTRPETLAPRFIRIEKGRVTELILEWLKLECDRTPFSIVSLEQKATVEIGGLQLDIVADRVDRLEDGTHLIIDYKTGKLHNKGWFEERIEEPQLPLYATTDSTDVAGVFLAGVSRANMGFAGVSEVDGLVPGIKAYAGWDGLIGDWRERLKLLATELLEGEAGVTPKNPNKDCEYCPLPALCRIHEQEDSVTMDMGVEE